MDKINCHSFERYSEKFKPLKRDCRCGGTFTCVDLKKSNRNQLTLICNNRDCSSITQAPRIKKGPAFPGAPWVRPVTTYSFV